MAAQKHTTETILATVRQSSTLAAAAQLLDMSPSRISAVVRAHGGEDATSRGRGRPRKATVEAVVGDYAEHGNASETARRLGLSCESVRQTIRLHAPQLLNGRKALRKAAKGEKTAKAYPPEKRPFAADPELAARAGRIGGAAHAA